ncbi:MAG: hypothetical protein KH828_09480 [Clostridiales bacterium]|nr:hypothetical protein [Clostridiales bacterium]
MANQKIGVDLNLALDATEKEREESLDLDVGYDREEERWTVIIRYSGDILALETPGIVITPLLGGFAIVNLPQSELEAFSARPEVEFTEKPKRLFFAVVTGRAVSCVNPVQTRPPRLFGKDVLVACIDSGERVSIVSS